MLAVKDGFCYQITVFECGKELIHGIRPSHVP